MSYGILLLRVVLGLTLAAHGSQKLFGWFGGGGPNETAGSFAQLGFRPPLLLALAAGFAEFAGGLLLALGLFTPFAGFVIAVVMLNAIATVHWRNGFWIAGGGYEFNLLILGAAVTLAAAGGLRFSLDNALGWADNLSGLWWGVGALGAAAIVSFLTLTLRRTPPAASG